MECSEDAFELATGSLDEMEFTLSEQSESNGLRFIALGMTAVFFETGHCQ